MQHCPGPITPTLLAQCVLLLNRKVCRPDKLTATETHYSRSQTTLQNLILDDIYLRQTQLKGSHLQPTPEKSQSIQQGDSVINRQKQNKHAARDMYIVTATDTKNVEIQKIAPTSSTLNLRSKNYSTLPSLLHVVHKGKQLHYSGRQPAEAQQITHYKPSVSAWSPVNPNFYNGETDDDDEDHQPQPLNLVQTLCKISYHHHRYQTWYNGPCD
jgi:hypothetical protein